MRLCFEPVGLDITWSWAEVSRIMGAGFSWR